MKNRNKTAIRRVVCKRPSWIHLNSWWTSFIKSSGGKQTHIAEPRSTKGKVRGRSFQCWSDEFNGFPLDSFELLFRQLLTCCLSTVRLLECFSWSSTIRTPGFKTGGIRWDTVGDGCRQRRPAQWAIIYSPASLSLSPVIVWFICPFSLSFLFHSFVVSR